MNYQQTIEYLYERLPMYQRIGKAAYKADLGNTMLLDKHLGHPHKKFRTVHVAGTNGKGSVSHYLASILQSAGFKTGLYTSPHLKDFRERIKINGEMIPEQAVVDFVNMNNSLFEKIKPSFFEMTVALAFDFFAKQNVDFAVIEAGLGGRLDSTNIIEPVLSVITNIGFDHTELLGNTIKRIAGEKAGIIKPRTPAVIGEAHPDTKDLFIDRADDLNSGVYFADSIYYCPSPPQVSEGKQIFDIYSNKEPAYKDLAIDLLGTYQEKNVITTVMAVDLLRSLGISISRESIYAGFAGAAQKTGLMGRWQILDKAPLTVCDTGHNEDGIKYITAQLNTIPHNTLHFVFGVVNDKEIEKILRLLPKNATYYFTQSSIPRALDCKILADKAGAFGLKGAVYQTVKEALDAARNCAAENDLIFIGGSTFVVAEVL